MNLSITKNKVLNSKFKKCEAYIVKNTNIILKGMEIQTTGKMQKRCRKDLERAEQRRDNQYYRPFEKVTCKPAAVGLSKTYMHIY